MKILHILADGPNGLATKIMDIQKKTCDIKVIDLSKKETSYEAVVEEIFKADKVVSW